MNFTYKLIKNNKEVNRLRTHSKRRFLSRLRTINWKDGHPTVYLKVSYGKRIDVFGKLVTFYNDGIYENKKDLWLAFNAFTEED